MILPAQLDIDRLLAALNEAGVDFVIIGGFAVSAHGYPRSTKDLDIVPDPEPRNLARLAELLKELDAELIGAEEFDPEELIHPDLAGLSEGGNFVLMTSYGRLDIMQFVAPEFEFENLRSHAIRDRVFGQPVMICGYDDLVAMKNAAGRPEDLLDLKRLAEARE